MIDERLYQHNLGEYREERLRIGNLDRDMRGFWSNELEIEPGARVDIDLYARVDGTPFAHVNGPEDVVQLKQDILDVVHHNSFNDQTITNVEGILKDEPRKAFLNKEIPTDLANQNLFQERILEGMKVQLEEAAQAGRDDDISINFDFKESLSKA